MKTIIEIFKDDLKRLKKSKIAMIIIVGIIFIPGIYAWLNVDSNWGPYDNTGNIPIAVVNNDKGITLLGERISIGDEIEDSLKNNNGMKWIFTNKKDAIKKVNSGEYYGAIVIPKNFSSKLTTILENDKISKPEFDFYVNNKKNAIAPIIVNKAVGTVQTSVNQAFVNTVIYKTLEKTKQLDVIKKGNDLSNDIVTKLEDTKNRVEKLKTMLKTTNLAGTTTSKSLSALRKILPDITDITDTTKESVNSMKNVAQTFNAAFDNIERDITSSIDSSRETIREVKEIINQSNAININDNIDKISTKLDKLLVTQKRLDETLKAITNTVSIPGVQSLDDKVLEIISEIESLQESINNSTNTLLLLNEMKQKINKIDSAASPLKNMYNNTIKSELSKIYKGASQSVINSSDLIINVKGSLDNIDESMRYIISALESGGELLNTTDIVLSDFQEDIDKLISAIKDIKKSEVYNNAVNLIKNNPSDVADFITTPVKANEIQMYHIDTYGSKMTPFYSVLACWVGCTLLTAILKISPSKSRIKKGTKDYQRHLGKFMLFGTLAMCQGLVIGLGDIALQVQTTNWLLFILTLMISSLVFVSIIYSLTLTFGKVGQALSIVIMVLQVAGSGGTFPIELLPRAFQLLQPIMPFYPAMNAVRETIGGFYGNDYIIYMLVLLCHMIIPLFLILVVSKLTSNIKEKLEQDLEKTDVIS